MMIAQLGGQKLEVAAVCQALIKVLMEILLVTLSGLAQMGLGTTMCAEEH